MRLGVHEPARYDSFPLTLLSPLSLSPPLFSKCGAVSVETTYPPYDHPTWAQLERDAFPAAAKDVNPVITSL